MSRPLTLIYALLFAGFYFTIVQWPGGSLPLVTEFGVFFGLGLLGALVANATGAGGGVVFIPFFATLGFTSQEAIGTSMAIQCCGMTAGTIAWLTQAQRQPETFHCDPALFKKLLAGTGPATIAGVLFAQYALPKPQWEVHELFRWFSIIFGVVLFAYTWSTRNLRPSDKDRISHTAYAAVLLTCFTGGIVTAWLSVGVGECVALLLFFLGFSARLAVAVGVFTSSMSVLSGVVHHLWLSHTVVFEVFLFAGQAALIGGYLARHITNWLGGFNLKLFFAVWIFVSGVLV